MNKVTKLVCFDMDGTLIRNTNSVRFLCELNNSLSQLKEIERLEEEKKIHWVEADYLKVNLIEGLSLNNVISNFHQYIEFIDNIDQVIKYLKKQGIKTILVTAGPIQVASIVGDLFGFDQVYGSVYEIKDHKFTSTIIEHLGEGGKLKSLLSYCKEHKIDLSQCVAVGDGASDLEVFNHCGTSIAINYTEALEGKADYYIRTNDINDILNYINSI